VEAEHASLRAATHAAPPEGSVPLGWGAPETAYDHAASLALSAHNREAATTSPAVAVDERNAWQAAEEEPEVEDTSRYGPGAADTAALLRELSGLNTKDEPDPPRNSPPNRPSAPSPAPAKKKKGLFGR
jgi:hypothetical protein